MAPEYKRPNSPVPAEWPEGAAYKNKSATDEKQATEIPWQEFFKDEKLRSIISLALENNRDLRIAALNIEKSRAIYQIQRSDLFPKIDASANANYQRVPEDYTGRGSADTQHQYNVGLGLTAYELDLFGRVRSLKDQALEQYLATEQAKRSVQITLVSQVAIGYLTLAADQDSLRLAKDTLASQLESYSLINKRFEAGVSSALELHQARTTVEAARVDIARYTTLVAQDINALNLVVGSTVPREMHPSTLQDTVTAIKEISPGISSEVLLGRPDILQAENILKSANANIGAARAAFFPRITLTSGVGFGSNDLSGLFKGDSFAWNFSPQITLPIFDAGANRARLEAAEADRKIMVAQYEKAIQTAFREVADALAERGTIDDRLKAQQSLTDATAERYRLSTIRFEKGIDSHLNVLDSQRSLYSAEQNLITARFMRLANLVTLYKALGGGDRAEARDE